MDNRNYLTWTRDLFAGSICKQLLYVFCIAFGGWAISNIFTEDTFNLNSLFGSTAVGIAVVILGRYLIGKYPKH